MFDSFGKEDCSGFGRLLGIATAHPVKMKNTDINLITMMILVFFPAKMDLEFAHISCLSVYC
jgi:hypothetical protein